MMRVFDSLSGQEMPVKAIGETLLKMWESPLNSGAESPREFRASQMNLVLHFGAATSVEEAKECFAMALGFARHYPCRIVVLCPPQDKAGKSVLRAKLFSECYLDAARTQCCCEALILECPEQLGEYLDHQLSLWVETDLPSYLWLHRLGLREAATLYREFFRDAKVVAFDGALQCNYSQKTPAAADSLTLHGGPKLVDLVAARLLPVRQSLGQSLSVHSPETLVSGLKKVCLVHSSEHQAKADCLLRWSQDCLLACASACGVEPSWESASELSEQAELELHFSYHNENYLHYKLQFKARTTSLDFKFGMQTASLQFGLRLSEPAKVLSEAFFFSGR